VSRNSSKSPFPPLPPPNTHTHTRRVTLAKSRNVIRKEKELQMTVEKKSRLPPFHRKKSRLWSCTLTQRERVSEEKTSLLKRREEEKECDKGDFPFRTAFLRPPPLRGTRAAPVPHVSPPPLHPEDAERILSLLPNGGSLEGATAHPDQKWSF